MNCSSSPVPRVATTRAWVSPRVNRAEPWVRGRTPTSDDDRADLVDVAAVDADAGVEDRAADDVGFQFLEHAAELGGVDAGRVGVGLGRASRRPSSWPRPTASWRSRLVGDLVGGGEVLADQLLHLGLDGVGVVRLEVEGLLGGVFGQFDDRVDHRLHALVGEHDAAQDVLFGQLLDFGFDHHHGVVGAGDDQVDPAVPSARRASGSGCTRRRR